MLSLTDVNVNARKAEMNTRSNSIERHDDLKLEKMISWWKLIETTTSWNDKLVVGEMTELMEWLVSWMIFSLVRFSLLFLSPFLLFGALQSEVNKATLFSWPKEKRVIFLFLPRRWWALFKKKTCLVLAVWQASDVPPSPFSSSVKFLVSLIVVLVCVDHYMCMYTVCYSRELSSAKATKKRRQLAILHISLRVFFHSFLFFYSPFDCALISLLLTHEEKKCLQDHKRRGSMGGFRVMGYIGHGITSFTLVYLSSFYYLSLSLSLVYPASVLDDGKCIMQSHG